MVRFERNTVVDRSPEVVFDLSLSIDVHRSSMADSHEAAVGGVTHGVIRLGEFVTWRARHLGRWWTMTNEITEYERPYRFVDEQRRGPFAWFRHEHRFEATHDGRATVMSDEVRFAAPFGLLGRAVESLVLKRYLAHLIDVRNDFIVSEATGT